MSPPSLHGVVDDPGELTAEALLAAHVDQLGDVIEAVGVETVAETTGVGRDVVAALVGGDLDVAGDLDLDDSAAILALDDDAPPADEIVSEGLQELLFGMTTGVLDVDVVAGELALDLEPREVQGMLEGRHPVTLGEYAALQHAITSRSA